MSGRVFNSGRCGLSRNSMSKFARSFFSTKLQGSEQRKSMSPIARCPAKRMSLNDMGCKACSHLGSKEVNERLTGHSQHLYASSSSICTLNYPPCLGEKLLIFASFSMAGNPPTTVSNTSLPLVHRLVFL